MLNARKPCRAADLGQRSVPNWAVVCAGPNAQIPSTFESFCAGLLHHCLPNFIFGTLTTATLKAVVVNEF